MFYLPTPLPGVSSEDAKSDDTDSVSSFNDYETDIQRLSENEIRFIRTYSLAGNLRLTKIRSIYWRLMLGIFPETFDNWITSLQRLRDQYNNLKTEFTIDPHGSSCIPDDNPLSLNQNSIWNKYFCDQELKRFIRLDVARTSADRNLSQLPDLHDRLVEILFLYARQNPDICYRQGMHELLTPIVSVVHSDCDNFLKRKSDSITDSTLTEILDPQYLDHDAFSIFSCVMNDMKKFYEVEGIPDSSGHFPAQNSLKESGHGLDNILENAISNYLNELQDELRRLDAPLHDHLKTYNINYSVFGIRWLRLLFGREFLFENLLLLWDAIFAVNSNLALVRYVSLALLIIQRRTILASDEVECLKHLMTCPCSIDVTQVINYALYLRNPKAYKKPILPKIDDEEYVLLNHEPQLSHREFATNQNNPKKSTKILKNKRIVNPTNSSAADQFNVVDDFSPRTFAMMVSELKRMRLMMSLCKIKLTQYQAVLAKSVPVDDDEVVRALEGIGEICQFLDVDHFALKSSPSAGPSDVETAHEAEETTMPRTESLSHSYSSPTLDVVATFLPPPNTDFEMELFKFSECELTDSSKFPRKHPLRRDI